MAAAAGFLAGCGGSEPEYDQMAYQGAIMSAAKQADHSNRYAIQMMSADETLASVEISFRATPASLGQAQALASAFCVNLYERLHESTDDQFPKPETVACHAGKNSGGDRRNVYSGIYVENGHVSKITDV
ncbi:hypothetical protein ACUN8C_05760 [Kushneria sp. Sum13]|uniref:hypothetical protein n=1 Tax=Kushneria sp. Sum13 TaxID=3459196 RepID=UPI0040457B54